MRYDKTLFWFALPITATTFLGIGLLLGLLLGDHTKSKIILRAAIQHDAGEYYMDKYGRKKWRWLTDKKQEGIK